MRDEGEPLANNQPESSIDQSAKTCPWSQMLIHGSQISGWSPVGTPFVVSMIYLYFLTINLKHVYIYDESLQ